MLTAKCMAHHKWYNALRSRHMVEDRWRLRQLHAVVHGRVQGVSFRYNAQREAQRLTLVGWVRNLPDGTVETVAAGQDDHLNAFADWLQTGPAGSHVTKVDMTWAETSEAFVAFEIRYGSD